MLNVDGAGVNTKIVHFGEEEKVRGAVTPPIFQNSLFVFEEMDDLLQSIGQPTVAPPFHYSRISNPTVDLAAQKIAMLEGAESARIMGSGMGAISLAIMNSIQSGSHVITIDTVYRPTRNMITNYLPKFGITSTVVDGRCPEEILDAIRPETSLIFLESPSSITFRMQDMEPITKVAREKGIVTAIDSTYNTPLHFQPLSIGFDLVCHSATKYMGGHSDLTAGVVCGSKARIDSLLSNELDLFGSILAPFPSWLLTRGLRTLKLRMKHHESSANTVAGWLEDRAEVDRVHHLGLPSFAQRQLVLKYFKGTGGLFSFEPKCQDGEKVKAFVNALNLFQRGVSWGGYESLAMALPVNATGIEGTRWFVRLFCGLEEPEDLIADLEQAMRVFEA